jgi:hypothetical protein
MLEGNQLIEGGCEKPTPKLSDTTHVKIPEGNYASKHTS